MKAKSVGFVFPHVFYFSAHLVNPRALRRGKPPTGPLIYFVILCPAGSIAQLGYLALAFCMGFCPLLWPLAAADLDLYSSSRPGSAFMFQVLFLSLMSAVSLYGSSRMEATFLFFIKVLVTSF